LPLWDVLRVHERRQKCLRMTTKDLRNHIILTTGRIARFTVCAASEGDDSIVLGECGHWGYGAKASKHTIDTVCEDSALDTTVE
jgi:hypothetical protein